MLNKRGNRLFFIALLVFISVVYFSSITFAATVTSVEKHTVTKGKTKLSASLFMVDGKPAFCVEHGKTAPKKGTSVTAEPYTSHDLDKFLFYGYNGLRAWNGFTSRKEMLSCTAVTVSFAHYEHGSLDWIQGYTAFNNYLATVPSPDIALKFSSTSVDGYYRREKNCYVTQSIKVSGAPEGEMRISTPDSVLIHMDNKQSGEAAETELSDNEITTEDSGMHEAILRNGDSFYLTIDAECSGDIVIKGINKTLKVTKYVTRSTSVQDLVQMNVEADNSNPATLTIKLKERPGLRLVKTDDAGSTVGDCTFKIVELVDGKLPNGAKPTAEALRSDEIEGILATVDEKGIYQKGGLFDYGFSYAMCEMTSPVGYMLSDEVKTWTVEDKAEFVEVEYINKKQAVSLGINKTGEKYYIDNGRIERAEIPLEGVRFEVKDEADGAYELVTDENGMATLEGILPGKYYVKEIFAPEEYLVDDTVHEVVIEDDKSIEVLEGNLSLVNKRRDTELTIVKADNQSGAKLEGAVFSVKDSDGSAIEVVTDETGTARIKNIPCGEYLIEEIQPPDGYNMDSKEQKVSISLESDETRICTAMFFDSKIKGFAPHTGDRGLIPLYVMLLVLSVGGVIVLTVFRRCDKF